METRKEIHEILHDDLIDERSGIDGDMLVAISMTKEDLCVKQQADSDTF